MLEWFVSRGYRYRSRQCTLKPWRPSTRFFLEYILETNQIDHFNFIFCLVDMDVINHRLLYLRKLDIIENSQHEILCTFIYKYYDIRKIFSSTFYLLQFISLFLTAWVSFQTGGL